MQYYSPNSNNIYWVDTHIFSNLPTLKNKLFNSNELNCLGTFDEGSQLSLLSYNVNNYKYSSYSLPALKCDGTQYCNYSYYWLRNLRTDQVASSGLVYTASKLCDGSHYANQTCTNTYAVRPIIILDL